MISFDSSLSVYDIEAVFNRLIYLPFLNKPISDKNDNKHLSDEIYDERDAVFTWAIKGLKDYIENNECFPEAKHSIKLKAKNMAMYCPEKIFFEEAIKKEDGVFESSSDIREAFDRFCRDCDVRGKANITAFLEEHEHIKKSKKRIDENGNLTSAGNPIYVYEGIRLRNKYRR